MIASWGAGQCPRAHAPGYAARSRSLSRRGHACPIGRNL